MSPHQNRWNGLRQSVHGWQRDVPRILEFGMAVMARKSMAVYKGEREYSHGPYQPWPWDGSANGW